MGPVDFWRKAGNNFLRAKKDILLFNAPFNDLKNTENIGGLPRVKKAGEFIDQILGYHVVDENHYCYRGVRTLWLITKRYQYIEWREDIENFIEIYTGTVPTMPTPGTVVKSWTYQNGELYSYTLLDLPYTEIFYPVDYPKTPDTGRNPDGTSGTGSGTVQNLAPTITPGVLSSNVSVSGDLGTWRLKSEYIPQNLYGVEIDTNSLPKVGETIQGSITKVTYPETGGLTGVGVLWEVKPVNATEGLTYRVLIPLQHLEQLPDQTGKIPLNVQTDTIKPDEFIKAASGYVISNTTADTLKDNTAQKVIEVAQSNVTVATREIPLWAIVAVVVLALVLID